MAFGLFCKLWFTQKNLVSFASRAVGGSVFIQWHVVLRSSYISHTCRALTSSGFRPLCQSVHIYAQENLKLCTRIDDSFVLPCASTLWWTQCGYVHLFGVAFLCFIICMALQVRDARVWSYEKKWRDMGLCRCECVANDGHVYTCTSSEWWV